MTKYMTRYERNMQVLILSFYFLLLAIISTIIITLTTNIKGIEITHNEPLNSEIEQVIEEVKDPFENYELFRLTHYYTGDPYGSGTCTASGVCVDKFDVHVNGWYIYRGSLVVANGVEYPLWTKLVLNIKGKLYEAIVLDKCGACRTDRRIDLFVIDKASGIDIKDIKVYEKNNFEK